MQHDSTLWKEDSEEEKARGDYLILMRERECMKRVMVSTIQIERIYRNEHEFKDSSKKNANTIN